MVESFPSLIGCPSRICGKRFTVVTLPLTLSRYATRQRFYSKMVRRIGRIDVPTDVKRERRLADQVFAFRQKGDQPCYAGTEQKGQESRYENGRRSSDPPRSYPGKCRYQNKDVHQVHAVTEL